jgi:hypothetical protein
MIRENLRFPSTDVQKALHSTDFAFDLSLTANHDALGHGGTGAMHRLNQVGDRPCTGDYILNQAQNFHPINYIDPLGGS